MHLTSESISQFIAGDGLPADRAHIELCAHCSAEVRKLQNALSSYSDFARDWGRREAPVEPSLSQLLGETRRPARLARWTGLAAVAAVVILVIVFPRVDKPPKAEPAAEDSARDADLLRQVNAQISRTAPVAMEPLLIWLEDKGPTSNTIGEIGEER
jgi:hypothetical protein